MRPVVGGVEGVVEAVVLGVSSHRVDMIGGGERIRHRRGKVRDLLLSSLRRRKGKISLGLKLSEAWLGAVLDHLTFVAVGGGGAKQEVTLKVGGSGGRGNHKTRSTNHSSFGLHSRHTT
jgi:hypothetical protein